VNAEPRSHLRSGNNPSTVGFGMDEKKRACGIMPPKVVL
jgi:hypothetical protein